MRYSMLSSLLLNEAEAEHSDQQLSEQLAEAKATSQRQARQLAALQASVAQRFAALNGQ